MSDSQRLIYAIIKFLRDQLTVNELPPDGAEGVEVAVQCLESAYNISSSDSSSLEVSKPLLDIFKDYLSGIPVQNNTSVEVSPEDKAQAEKFKNEGNSHLHAENYKEAIACYTRAISLDPKNAVYYCNRAAAFTKMSNHYSAIEDCKTALRIDPDYSKAYSRLGLAYSCLNQNREALESYKKALELEPQNESVLSNIQLIEEKLMASGGGNQQQNLPNVDLRTVLTNPAVLNIASQMLTNPSMQSMMTNILQSQPSSSNVMDAVLQAGQQLAQQMESENPGLVDQLRRHLSGAHNNSTSSSTTPPPPDPTP